MHYISWLSSGAYVQVQVQSIHICEISILETLSLCENIRFTEYEGPHFCYVLQVSFVHGFCLVVFYWIS